jgi:hypothetical protein
MHDSSERHAATRAVLHWVSGFDRRSPGKLALATRLARRDNLANQLIKTLVHDPEKTCPALGAGGDCFSEIMHKQ